MCKNKKIKPQYSRIYVQFGVVALNNTHCTETTALSADPPQAGLGGKAACSSPPKTSILREVGHRNENIWCLYFAEIWKREY